LLQEIPAAAILRSVAMITFSVAALKVVGAFVTLGALAWAAHALGR
jgi:hypothetical protein